MNINELQPEKCCGFNRRFWALKNHAKPLKPEESYFKGDENEIMNEKELATLGRI